MIFVLKTNRSNLCSRVPDGVHRHLSASARICESVHPSLGTVNTSESAEGRLVQPDTTVDDELSTGNIARILRK